MFSFARIFSRFARDRAESGKRPGATGYGGGLALAPEIGGGAVAPSTRLV